MINLSNHVRNLKQGTALPSLRALSREWGVGRNILNRQAAELVAGGRLARHGRTLVVAGSVALRGRIEVLAQTEGQLTDLDRLEQSLGCEIEAGVEPDPNRERHRLLEMLRHPPAGLVIWGGRHPDLLGRLRHQGVRIAVCGTRLENSSCFLADNRLRMNRAVAHLRELGHRNIAFLHPNAFEDPQHELHGLIALYEQSCREYGLNEAASRHAAPPSLPGRVTQVKTWLRETPPVTAVVCWDIKTVNVCVRAVHGIGGRLPRDLSVLSLLESIAAARNDPPVTTVDIDEAALMRMALLHLWEEFQLAEGRPRSPRQILATLHSQLIVRETTAEAPTPRKTVESPETWSDDPEARREEVEAINGKRFPEADAGEMRPVDLSPACNRAFAPRASWLGAGPLKGFAPGDHRLHGIPFRVGPGAPLDPVCVTVRSGKMRTTAGRTLPREVVLPLHRTCRRLYLLHAAGWVPDQQPFAEYEAELFNGDRVRLPVRGPGGDDSPTVQDWHPSHPRVATPRLLPWIITDKGDPLRYERTLYVFRWNLPPDAEGVETLTLRSLDPDRDASIALLGLCTQTLKVSAEMP